MLKERFEVFKQNVQRIREKTLLLRIDCDSIEEEEEDAPPSETTTK